MEQIGGNTKCTHEVLTLTLKPSCHSMLSCMRDRQPSRVFLIELRFARGSKQLGCRQISFETSGCYLNKANRCAHHERPEEYAPDIIAVSNGLQDLQQGVGTVSTVSELCLKDVKT